MKIVVNMTCLEPPLTGIGHYTKEILKEMLKDERIEDIQGFMHLRWMGKSEIANFLEDGAKPNIQEGPKKKSPWVKGIKEVVKKIPFSRMVYRKYLSFRQRQNFFKYGSYIYWEPNYVPIFKNSKSFVTVHDLSHIRYPQFHPIERIRELNAGLKMALDRGSKIFTVSEFSKDEIVNVFGISKERVFVVPNGTSDRFFCRDGDEIEGVKEKYGIEGDYILSVCTIEPRKNLVNVCRAYAKLDGEIKKKYRLILAGKNGWLNRELESVIAPMERDGFVKRIGYVDDGDLPALYSGASLFVYLSLYEGYGMPIAEAIRCGAPTLTSNIEPMKSVAGDKAHLANPLDVEDIKNKMIEALSGVKPQTKDKTPYIFSWSESAKKMVDIFEREWVQKS